MERANVKSLTNKIMIVALAGLLAIAGCSRSPVGDTNTSVEPQLLQRSASSSSVLMTPANLYCEQVISSEQGGRLELMDVILEIPPHAVPNDTTFSISIPDINVFYNEFGTDGLVFDEPVKVTMSYRDADLSMVDESTIRIGFYNEVTGQFDDVICSVDFVNKTVTGYLNHFSAYGLISDLIDRGSLR
ncbi:MAG TPA: hypothetical protein PLF13_04470 [candidate division Zixibacteria bacterium]|nr:hypothetical protein [candidate division Zixibacteria bacterium]